MTQLFHKDIQKGLPELVRSSSFLRKKCEKPIRYKRGSPNFCTLLSYNRDRNVLSNEDDMQKAGQSDRENLSL